MRLKSIVRKEYIYVAGMLAMGSSFYIFYKAVYSDFEIFASGCGCVLTTAVLAEGFGN